MPLAPLIPLMPVLAAALVLALALTWEVTLGPLMRGVATAVENLPITSAGRRLLHLSALAAAIVAFEQALHRRIGEAVGHMAAPLAAVLFAIGRAFVYPAAQLAALADDVGTALWQLRRYVVPALIAATFGPLAAAVRVLAAQVAHLAHRVPVQIIHEVPRVVKPTVTRIVNQAVALPWPRLGRVEREAGALGRRIDGLARRVAPAAFAAAAVATIGRLGFGWVRCSRVKNAGKAVCGMDSGLLDGLLADTLLIVGTISLVEFAEGLQAGMGEVAPQIRRFWRA